MLVVSLIASAAGAAWLSIVPGPDGFAVVAPFWPWMELHKEGVLSSLYASPDCGPLVAGRCDPATRCRVSLAPLRGRRRHYLAL